MRHRAIRSLQGQHQSIVVCAIEDRFQMGVAGETFKAGVATHATGANTAERQGRICTLEAEYVDAYTACADLLLAETDLS